MLKRTKIRHLWVHAVCGSAWLLFGSNTLLAQDEVLPAGLQFFPASLNSEFTGATRVTLGRQSMPGISGLMLANVFAEHEESSRDVILYLQVIHKLEESEGDFTESLYEPLLSLGAILQEGGRHAEALEVFERVAFINKTTHGLYSEDQINLTRQRIASLKAVGDSVAVQESLERVLLINQKLHGNQANETAFALQDLGVSKLDNFLRSVTGNSYRGPVQPGSRAALSLNSGSNAIPFDNLHEAQKTFIHAIKTVVDNKTFTDNRLYEVENNLIATYYLNANLGEILKNPDSIWKAAERDSSSIMRLKKMRMLPVDFRNGEAAYMRQLRYLQQNDQANLGQLSGIMLALSDWYQLFGQYEKAREQRQKLLTMLNRLELASDDINYLIQKDAPVLLPTFMDSPLSARPFKPEQTMGHIDLTIQITPAGEVSDVETLGISDGTPDAVISELISMVRHARFRVDNDEGSTSGIRYYYQY